MKTIRYWYITNFILLFHKTNHLIQQEITKEVSGEDDRDIEARIINEDTKEDPEPEEPQPHIDKFGEKEKQLENFTDDLSNNAENKDKTSSQNNFNNHEQSEHNPTELEHKETEEKANEPSNSKYESSEKHLDEEQQNNEGHEHYPPANENELNDESEEENIQNIEAEGEQN